MIKKNAFLRGDVYILTSFNTSEEPPITESLPIEIPLLTAELIEIALLLPIFTFPPRHTPGAIELKSIKTESCSITDAVLTITNFPIFT